jgi:hypothetical protein
MHRQSRIGIRDTATDESGSDEQNPKVKHLFIRTAGDKIPKVVAHIIHNVMMLNMTVNIFE